MSDYYSLPTGWLSPTGEFVDCSSYAHLPTADKILEELGIEDDDSDERLFKMGWCSIHLAIFFDRGYVFQARELTQEQIRFLEPYRDYMTDAKKNEYDKYK